MRKGFQISFRCFFLLNYGGSSLLQVLCFALFRICLELFRFFVEVFVTHHGEEEDEGRAFVASGDFFFLTQPGKLGIDNFHIQ